jgi:hypothetical protein
MTIDIKLCLVRLCYFGFLNTIFIDQFLDVNKKMMPEFSQTRSPGWWIVSHIAISIVLTGMSGIRVIYNKCQQNESFMEIFYRSHWVFIVTLLFNSWNLYGLNDGSSVLINLGLCAILIYARTKWDDDNWAFLYFIVLSVKVYVRIFRFLVFCYTQRLQFVVMFYFITFTVVCVPEIFKTS